MIEGAVQAPVGARSRFTAWVGQHPGIIPLILATVLGLVVFPAVVGVLKDHDVMVSGRISLINVVWLIVAVVLGVTCLVARSSMSRDLGDGLRQLIAATQASGDPIRRAGFATADVPALGASIVRGVFDLIILLVIQGIIRVPFVAVIGVYEPKALVDGSFVAVVVVIALFALFGLYRVVRPLTLYLVTVGLDKLVPTAGFAVGDLPDAPAPRTSIRTAAPSVSRGTAQPTIAAGPSSPASDLPTVAAAATIAEGAEATVAAGELMNPSSAEATLAEPARASEATVVEVPSRPTPPAEATIAEVATASPPTPAVAGTDQTVVPDQTLAGDGTMPPISPEGHGSEQKPSKGSERRS